MEEESIIEVYRRHEEEIVEYQNNCPHKKLSEWQRSYYAPGHSHPNLFVKKCLRCDSVIKRKRICNICGDFVNEREWVKGDGSCFVLGENCFFHKECMEKHEHTSDCQGFNAFFQK